MDYDVFNILRMYLYISQHVNMGWRFRRNRAPIIFQSKALSQLLEKVLFILREIIFLHT